MPALSSILTSTLILAFTLATLSACSDKGGEVGEAEDVTITSVSGDQGKGAAPGTASAPTSRPASKPGMKEGLGRPSVPTPKSTGPQPGPSDFSGVDIPLNFVTQPGWRPEAPDNNMRVQQHLLPAAEGDPEDAEVAVFLFPGAGGTPEANLSRWESQMKAPNGGAIGSLAQRRQEVIHGKPVWSVDMTGRYATSSMTDGSKIDKPNTRFIGYVIVTNSDTFFVKCIGPAKTIARWEASIKKYVEDACKPRFAARPGFIVESPSSSMRKAQFRLPKAEAEAKDAELVVFFFPGGGSVQSNLDRWIGQFEQPDGRESKDVAKIETEKVGRSTITFLDISGTVKTTSMTDGSLINEPNQRMIAAIIEDEGSFHFVKASGGVATIEKWREEIIAFVRASALD
jgi:hypothetical protein